MKLEVAWKTNNFHPKCTNMIWHTRKDEVMIEIAMILQVDNATMQMPRWFAAWMPAIKNLIAAMTNKEMLELNLKMEEIAKNRYSEKQQRRWVPIPFAMCHGRGQHCPQNGCKVSCETYPPSHGGAIQGNGDIIHCICVLPQDGWKACHWGVSCANVVTLWQLTFT